MSEPATQEQAHRLRIYLGESDRWRGRPLYIALLETLRAQGMAGATVLRGVAGFGARSRFIHTAAILRLSEDLPLVIDVVDTPQKIERALEHIAPMVGEGLITVEAVRVIKYTHRYLNPLPAEKPVSEVMTGDVLSLSPEWGVHAAWEQMLQTHIKVFPVVDASQRVTGILTDEDLLERAGVQQRLAIATRLNDEILGEEIQRLRASALSVAEIMTQPVITAAAEEALGMAVARMHRAGLKRMPVVDAHGRLCGMLSRLDILRQVAGIAAAPETPYQRSGKTIKDIMSPQVPVVPAGENLPGMIQKFLQTGTHRLVVVDDRGKAIGILSDSDVIARLQPARQQSVLAALRRLGRPPAGQETAADLMSPGALTASLDLSLVEAVRIMINAGRKWLVVVDEQGCPLGLVDRHILFDALAPLDTHSLI